MKMHVLCYGRVKSQRTHALIISLLCIVAIIFALAIPACAEESVIENIVTQSQIIGSFNDHPVYKYTFSQNVDAFRIDWVLDVENMENSVLGVYAGLEIGEGAASIDSQANPDPITKTRAEYLAAKEVFENNKSSFSEMLSIDEHYEYSIYNFYGLSGLSGYLIIEWEINSGEEPPVSVIYGDLNGDKEITADDAAMLYGALRGTVTLTEEQTAAADVNHDSEITADDAGMVYGYLRGQITSFEPAGN